MSTEPEIDALSMQIRAAIGSAIADLDAANIGGEDRSTVLRAVLDIRLGSAQVVAPRIALSTPTPAPESQATGPGPTPATGDGDVLDKIAGVMKLDREVLEYVYDVQDGAPALVISAKKLPERKAEGTKVIAQLLAAARQAAGIEDWTSAATIRSVVGDYGRLDSNNFAAAISGLDKVSLSRGKGASRELKITRAGMEEISALVNQLVGDAA